MCTASVLAVVMHFEAKDRSEITELWRNCIRFLPTQRPNFAQLQKSLSSFVV